MDFNRGVRGRFFNLAVSLEPENIWMDGEATKAQAKGREAAIRAEWKALECLVGRTVSEDEVWEGFW